MLYVKGWLSASKCVRHISAPKLLELSWSSSGQDMGHVHGRHTSRWHREHDVLNIQTVASTWNARTTWFCYVNLFGSLGRGTWYFACTHSSSKLHGKPAAAIFWAISMTILGFPWNPQSWPVNQPPIHTRLQKQGNHICSILEFTFPAVPPKDDQENYCKSSMISFDRCIMKLTQVVNQYLQITWVRMIVIASTCTPVNKTVGNRLGFSKVFLGCWHSYNRMLLAGCFRMFS